MIVQQLSKRRLAIPLEEKKENMKKRICSHLDSIQSPTKFEIMERILAPLTPTLSATGSIKSFTTATADERPANAKITVQRRLFSTKKKRKKSQTVIEKPTASESTSVAVSLLQ